MECESPDADLLQQFLADRNENCPRCGYNLRGLRGGMCPECGEGLRLTVGLIRPKLAAQITGLIGLAAGAGLNGLLLIYLFLMLLREGFAGMSFMDDFLFTNAGGLLVEGVALGAWLFLWRRIYRLTSAIRWSLAAVCWLLTLANIIFFTFMIR